MRRRKRLLCARLGLFRGLVFEIGDIPAAALQLKPCCRDLALKCHGMTGGALDAFRICHFLQHLILMMASAALVFIDWHR